MVLENLISNPPPLLFLKINEKLGPERGNDLPKAMPLVIGGARSTTQFLMLSIETASSYNGFWSLHRGERLRSNVRCIQHTQRLNSKEVPEKNRLG